MALYRFSYRALGLIGIVGVTLSVVCIVALVAAWSTGNYDHNVATLRTPAVLGVAVFFAMWAVRRKRLAEAVMSEVDL